MLTQPNRNWRSILESHHAVLPISNMITQHLSKYSLTEIESIEIHVKCIYKTIAVIINDDGARFRAYRFEGGGIGEDTIEPRWVGCNIIFGREVNRAIEVSTIHKSVQKIKV